jgi:dTMP kinase
MFITLEGGDGSGKTTQFRLLGDWLHQQGRAVLSLREPGGTAIGEAVREVLLHHKAGAAMHANTELLLFCASRAQLVAERIKPHLAQGGVVLCDRFADSTLAYQGYGRGLDLDVLRAILAFATQGLQPDLTLYFDVKPDIGLARRAGGGGVNRLDAEPTEFHARVRRGYVTLAQADPKRWRIIDGNAPVSAVFERASQEIATRIG